MRYVLYIILLVFGMRLGIGGMNTIARYKKECKALEETINNMDQDMKCTTIRLNDSIQLYQSEIKSLNVTHDILKSKYGKLLNAIKTKPKDVKNITQIDTEITGKDTVMAVIQPFNGLKASLDDNFIKINVEVLPDKNTIIDYRIRDSLTVISYYKRRSILFGLITWRKYNGVRVINHNPKVGIVNLTNLNVIE